MNTGKTAGLIMIVVGVTLFVGATLFVGSGYLSRQVGLSGAILGVGLFGLLPLLLFCSVGAFLYRHGRAEEQELKAIRKKELLLGVIQARGQASLGNLMLETNMTRDEVRNAIYHLVRQELFAGYIDWRSQTFYSQDATRIGSNTCPSCGGVRELVGKGIVKCPYCGVELFIPPGAPQTFATPLQPSTEIRSY